MSKQSKLSDYEQKYKEIELIGRGTQGSAMLVECRSDKKRYVSKKVILTNLSEKDQNNAIQELKLLREMKHPNIVKFIESYKEKNKVIIIMEYCEYGDLSQLIKQKSAKGEQIEESIILQWFIQICSALSFIHSKKVIHRDIKSSNIFLTKSNCVKIGDFGISKQLENSMDKANTLVGTPYYLSPEVCQNKPYTYKSDMWSLGCVIYELCSLKHPFQSNSLMSLVMKIATEKAPKIPQNYSLMTNGFIRSLLQKIPEKRPSAQDILNNQNIKKLMKEFVQQKQEMVNDIQNMKQILISKGASQGEITLMEKQLQEKIQRQQEQVKAQIQAQSQLMSNESAKKQQPNQSKIVSNQSKQSYVQSQYIKDESEKRDQLSITQQEREIQQQLSNLQSEVMKSYQRLSTPQNSSKKDKSSQCFKDSDATIKSEMIQTSSNKKGRQMQAIQDATNYSDGENTIQSIAVSQFENTNKKQIVQSNISNVSCQQNKKDQLESTVKSFIAEDSQEYHSSSLGKSKREQNYSTEIKNESQNSETNSSFYTSSEGERESDSDNQSEKFTPSMALDLVQNESILLSKFLVSDKILDSQQENQKPIQQIENQKQAFCDIQEYSTENPVIFGSRQNQNNDNLTETSVSLNVSLTQDSVFLKSKLGLTGKTFLQNNLVNLASKTDKDEDQKFQLNKNNIIVSQEKSNDKCDDLYNNNLQFKLEKNSNSLKHNSQKSEDTEEYYEDDFEEYEDDFEEYQEDEDDQNGQDKSKTSQKFDCHFLYESDEEKYEDDYDQLDDILSIYKDQLNNHQNDDKMSESLYKFDLTEIIEESLENSAAFTQKSSQIYEL
ncbi:plant dual-specificity MAP kinase kinase family domain protein (macronuclear) [Tetrahymena thermophila SB210]|uniref:non-specific serine/threonine protein kinase n=1 Tax=Tetrahymena thermophila (strain SB210) TaxID=312017 RepID=I7LX81_TETTS|nr:plant dual-specificity MAP kinase kinase family domain protein [Tetrahymena thermophila SB210]EAS03928.2 plant dual-specificity MAP kinase kinase family domain protein [Tetrahymena thermophila SB210]|eukprot:XP_001024173.2 plant dual-specificity MAP kinase kinase family domain protein [Tetrahymena thermophila SB210]